MVVSEILAHIKEQVGADLEECTCFPGFRTLKGKTYVNLSLPTKVSESPEFSALERLSRYSSKISNIEPNGSMRVAVFIR